MSIHFNSVVVTLFFSYSILIIFPCDNSKYMVRNNKILLPPHLYFVATLPRRTNTTVNVNSICLFV